MIFTSESLKEILSLLDLMKGVEQGEINHPGGDVHRYLISLLLLSLLLLPTNVQARETPPDYKHVALMNILLAADHFNTLYIATHPDEYYEKWNKTIPSYPSTGNVNRYFLVVGVVVNGLVYVLPDDWSDRLMVVTETVEVFAVGNNIGIGIGFSMP